MEREILIANTKTQKRYKISTDATTLGDLKNVLDSKGIDYSGMSFTEGISNTQLLDDSSLLPTNLTYKGKTTNNLVMILTNTTKKIESGAVSAERAELFDFIKGHNLQSKVFAEFNRNMTQVSTAELQNFVHIYGSETPENAEVTAASTETPTEPENEKSDLDNMADDILAQHGFSDEEPESEEGTVSRDDDFASKAIDAVGALVKHFVDKGILNYDDDFDSLYDVIRDSF